MPAQVILPQSAREKLGLPRRGPIGRKHINGKVDEAEAALVALLPKAVAVLTAALDDDADLRTKVDVAHRVMDRVLGRAAPASVAPAERPDPLSPDDVHGQLQHLASLLTPAALDAIKSLVTNDLRQQGKLGEADDVEVGVT